MSLRCHNLVKISTFFIFYSIQTLSICKTTLYKIYLQVVLALIDIKNIFKYIVLFFIGGLIYYFLEIFYRGYSHFSMIIVGGICFLFVGSINHIFKCNLPLIFQMLISAIGITSIEFISGLIINVWLNLNVWDYSNQSFNLLGQVCLNYSIIWFFLSLIAIYLNHFIRWKFFGEDFPNYKYI